MVRGEIVFVVVLLGLTYKPIGATVKDLQHSQSVQRDIPQRCINNTVTVVSCKNVDSEDALLPHPDDCELFYYCISPDHKPICRQCPALLHFNPSLHVCDMPERAGCVINLSP